MKRILLFLLVFFYTIILTAQSDYSFYFNKEIKLNSTIKGPGFLSGQRFGEWHFTHDQLVNYLRYLDEKSNRVKMVEYGRTHENRPLYLMFISSPENLATLDKIREDHLKYIYSNSSENTNEGLPIIVWLGYGVHGNESSASNSSLLTGYYLAASEEQEVSEILKQSVIIIDPCLNPDGFNRAANWVNTHQSNNWIDDQVSVQFTEAWPGGRTNHYWFDLNRDWLLVQQPESKARLEAFHKWKPAILTDHHEMGTNGTFFFQPGVLSRINPLTPEKNYTLTYKIGTYHSKALDNIGSLYFSEEIFDDYYYGKGSSYPDVNGSIGILFEQSRVNGQIVRNNHGITTFAQAIKNQFTVSLSTINAAIENKEMFRDYQREFYSSIDQLAKNDAVRAYAFGCKDDPIRINYFLDILKSHQIDFYKNKENIAINNSIYKPDEAFIVPLNQNQYRLIKSIFDKKTEFKDSIFYDLSTWTFPLAFNIDYKALTTTSKVLGNKIKNVEKPIGNVTNQSKIGYLFNWTNYDSPTMLHKLLEHGLLVKVASKPLQIKVENEIYNFGNGSIFIPVSKQNKSADKLYNLMEEISKEHGIEIIGLENGFRYSGIHLGSSYFIPLKKPKILMLVGNGINSRQAGEVWHLFDFRLNIPITRVDVNRLNRIDLFNYNTLIIPGGEHAFSETESEKLEAWLKNGGNLIAIGNSAKELDKNGWIKLKIRQPEKLDSTVRFNYSSAREYRRSNSVNGLIFNAKVDITHPVAYGLSTNMIPVFRNSSFTIEKLNDPFSCPVYIPENSLLSGYLNKRNKKQLEKSAYVLNYSLGKGNIIVFADNPNFRGYWYGTNKLFVNAVFFGGIIR